MEGGRDREGSAENESRREREREREMGGGGERWPLVVSCLNGVLPAGEHVISDAGEAAGSHIHSGSQRPQVLF